MIRTAHLYTDERRAIFATNLLSEPGTRPPTSYKINEARKNFSQVLERASKGEEIIIMRGTQVYARIGPAEAGGKRTFGLLRQRSLPDDLFDDHDADQAVIDAGDWNDDTGVFRGPLPR